MVTTTLDRFGLNEYSENVSMEMLAVCDGTRFRSGDSGSDCDDSGNSDCDVIHTKDEDDSSTTDAMALDSPSSESACAKHKMETSPTRRRRKAASESNADASRKNVMTAAPAAATTKPTKKSTAPASSTTAAPLSTKSRARNAAASQSSENSEQQKLERLERKQASIDQRRKRNREAMQRARQRDRDYMDGLRDTARDLERKHNALLARVDAQLANASTTGAAVNTRVAELQQRLETARGDAKALKRQNLEFLDAIGDRIKREDRMEGLLRELMREQATQEHVLNEIFRESLAASQPSALFTEARAMREILRSRHDRQLVERHGFVGAAVGELFGWSTQHCVTDSGRTFHFAFTKTFRHKRAARVMAMNWRNAMQMVSYRSAAEAATQRWYVVQKINDDTYLLARELCDPKRAGAFIRLLYLRFRLHEPDGSFSIVTQSVQQHEATQQQTQQLHNGDGDASTNSVYDVWATEACMWTLFTPVRERASDGSEHEHCQIKMVGSSTVGSAASARQNVLETILGLLRWENINVGPMLSLTRA